MSDTLPRILFCAKYRVNFAMFNPVYQILRHRSDVRALLSTGRYRKKPLIGWLRPKRKIFENETVFSEFDVDPADVIKTGSRDRTPYEVYVSSNESTRIQPRNSRLSVQIYHGVSFRNFAVNSDYLRFDKLFFPGRYMMEQYVARGFLKPDDPRIEIMGMPKLDRLVDGTIRREDVLTGLGLDSSRPTVLWCPTGARHNSYELLGHEGFKAIEAAGVNLIVKLHDHPHLKRGESREEVLSFARSGLGPNSRLVDHSDVAPLLVAADLLVSDASSVAYEYCILDRPIVFVDVPKLLGDRAKSENSAMDTETHGRNVGRIVQGGGEMTAVIREELGQPSALSARRRAAAEHIFYQPGTAAQRMADRLVQLASN